MGGRLLGPILGLDQGDVVPLPPCLSSRQTNNRCNKKGHKLAAAKEKFRRGNFFIGAFSSVNQS